LATLNLFRILEIGVLGFQCKHEAVVVSLHYIMLKYNIIKFRAAFAH